MVRVTRSVQRQQIFVQLLNQTLKAQLYPEVRFWPRGEMLCNSGTPAQAILPVITAHKHDNGCVAILVHKQGWPKSSYDFAIWHSVGNFALSTIDGASK